MIVFGWDLSMLHLLFATKSCFSCHCALFSRKHCIPFLSYIPSLTTLSLTLGTKSSKGPKSSKEPKSTKAHPPLYSPPHPPYSPPYSPHYSPSNYSPPPVHPPTTKCPDKFDFESCLLSDNADTCDVHSSCKPACVPKFCTLPQYNPHKIHGDRPTDGDEYVKLGSACGYFHYMQGYDPRHLVEVCCIVKEAEELFPYRRDDEYDSNAQCSPCNECAYPQKVADACCLFAQKRRHEEEDEEATEEIGRDGSYQPQCKGNTPVCCKCGPDNGPESYKCIGPHEDCTVCKDECPVVKNEVTPNLIVSEINEPGFGDLDNKYSLAMATFKDYVYVGTLNAPGFPEDLGPWFLGEPLDSTGAKVYRGKPSATTGEWMWDPVLDFGTKPENFGIRKMLVLGNYLYLVTANHGRTTGNGVELWQTSDGIDWMHKNEPGFGDPSNISGRSLAECGGYLYVGVENRDSGAQLWRHKLVDSGAITGTLWEAVTAATNGFGNPNNYFITELVQIPEPNILYAGTLNGLDGMELWRITSCDAINVAEVAATQVFGGGWPNECPLPPIDLPKIGPLDLCATNSGALTLHVAQTSIGPALFLGTLNYVFGASLFVTFDGIDFIPIYRFGNGDFRQSYVWSMEEYNGRLYVGTFGRPNLLYLLGIDLPNIDLQDIDWDAPSPNLDPEQFAKYMQLMYLQLGGTNDMPVIPGITADAGTMAGGAATGSGGFPDFNVDDIVESGQFSLFSLNLSEFSDPPKPKFPVSLVTETDDSFGSCYPYGLRTMAVYEDKLLLGSAGASHRGGTLVYEATARAS